MFYIVKGGLLNIIGVFNFFTVGRALQITEPYTVKKIASFTNWALSKKMSLIIYVSITKYVPSS